MPESGGNWRVRGSPAPEGNCGSSLLVDFVCHPVPSRRAAFHPSFFVAAALHRMRSAPAKAAWRIADPDRKKEINPSRSCRTDHTRRAGQDKRAGPVANTSRVGRKRLPLTAGLLQNHPQELVPARGNHSVRPNRQDRLPCAAKPVRCRLPVPSLDPSLGTAPMA